jgi:hypothetical protein
MKPIADPSEMLILLGLATSQPSDEESALLQLCMTAASGAVRRHLKYDPVYDERTEYYPMMDHGRANFDVVWEATATTAYERRLPEAVGNELQLKHIPIRSITSLKIDYDGRSGARSGSFGSDTTKTLGEDYWPNYDAIDSDGVKICNDGILRSIGAWPSEPGSVKVVYYAGYKGAELRGQDDVIDASPIWEVCLDEAVRRFHRNYSRRKNTLAGFVGPLTSERLGDYSYTVDSGLLSRLIGGGDIDPDNLQRLSDFENYGWMLGG